MTRRFPGKLGVRTACHVSDDALDPIDHGAYCHSCEKVVHDFSALTFTEAAALVAAAKAEGRAICGAIVVRDHDGAVLLADGYVKPESLVRKRLPTMIALGAMGLAACSAPTPVTVPVLTPPPMVSEPVAPAPALPPPIEAAPEPAPIATPEPEPAAAPAPAPVQPAPQVVTRAKAPVAKPPVGRGKKPPASAFRGDMDI